MTQKKASIPGKHGLTRADRNKQDNAKMLLQRLQGYGFIDQTLKNIKQLEDLSKPMDQTEVARIKGATDIRLKLLAKIVPDRKAVEITGEDGKPVEMTINFIPVLKEAITGE